jgi:hypothetical protein
MWKRMGFALAAIMLAGTLGGCLTGIHGAAADGDLQAVRTMLDQGMSVEERDGIGRTPLILAAWEGHLEVVRFLLDRGADINAQYGPGITALIRAAWLGRTEVVRLLLERGARCCDVTGDGRTPLQVAQESGHGAIVRLLLQAEARERGAAPQSLASASATTSSAAAIPKSDVDTVPAASGKLKPNAYAIVIGIEQYQQGLPKADFAARDAQVTKDYLTKVMGYQEENVVLLTNERATKSGVEKYVEHWLPNRVEKDASVFIYYSGHGSPNPKTSDAYLVPYDGDPAFVDATGYPLKRLYEQLGKLPAKEVVVMLDSCFSGAGGRSVIAEGMRPMGLSIETPILAGNKTIVLAASSGTQVSSTFKAQGHGLLTYYFLKGLRGEADANKDGSTDLSEVFAYVKPQVERTARREFNNEQTPQLLGSPELLQKGVRLVERDGK